MFRLKKNVAGQVAIPFKGVDITDRPAGKTGVTITLTICKDDGNWTTPTGTVSEPTTANGIYHYHPSDADCNVTRATVHYTGSGIDAGDFVFETYIPDTATLDTIAAQVTTVDGIVDTIVADTTTLKVDTGLIKGYTDTVETAISTLDGKVVTLDGKVVTLDTVADLTKVDTTNILTNLSTLDGKVVVIDTVVDLIKVDTTEILADINTPGVLTPVTSTTITNFSRTIQDIIEQAHEHFGEVMPYNQRTKDLLQTIVLNLQPKGYMPWTTEPELKSFTAPSEVLVSSVNYTCYFSHTSSAETQPGVGANWTRYWYEGGENGIAWVTATAYASTGDFYPDSDTLEIQEAKIRYNGEDCPVELISELSYIEIPDKQATGMPTKLYLDDKIPPRVFLWPQPARDNVADYLLVYTRTRKLKNLSGEEEVETDFKAGVWTLALIKLLVYHMALQRPSVPIERIIMFKKAAEEAIDNARCLKRNKIIVRKDG